MKINVICLIGCLFLSSISGVVQADADDVKITKHLQVVENAIKHCEVKMKKEERINNLAVWRECHFPAIRPLAEKGNFIAQMTMFMKLTEFVIYKVNVDEATEKERTKWEHAVLNNPEAPAKIKDLVISVKMANK